MVFASCEPGLASCRAGGVDVFTAGVGGGVLASCRTTGDGGGVATAWRPCGGVERAIGVANGDTDVDGGGLLIPTGAGDRTDDGNACVAGFGRAGAVNVKPSMSSSAEDSSAPGGTRGNTRLLSTTRVLA